MWEEWRYSATHSYLYHSIEVDSQVDGRTAEAGEE
jgi:hypothetical protein